MHDCHKPTLSTDFRHAPLAPTEFRAVRVDRDLDHLRQVLTVIRAERRRIHNLVMTCSRFPGRLMWGVHAAVLVAV